MDEEEEIPLWDWRRTRALESQLQEAAAERAALHSKVMALEAEKARMDTEIRAQKTRLDLLEKPVATVSADPGVISNG